MSHLLCAVAIFVEVVVAIEASRTCARGRDLPRPLRLPHPGEERLDL